MMEMFQTNKKTKKGAKRKHEQQKKVSKKKRKRVEAIEDQKKLIPQEINSQCKLCSKLLVKQFCNPDGTPYNPIVENDPTEFTFGKHKGRAFESVHKSTIRIYLFKSGMAGRIFFKYPQMYCALHRFLYRKWPDTERVRLLCGCRRGARLWSCPVHGTVPIENKKK